MNARTETELCVGHGLTIVTQIPIPGAMLATGDEAAEIEIDYDAPPPWTERLAWGPYRVADADLFEFAMPGVARFTCRDRRRITITPNDGADEAAIAAMLVATALPALLWARGEIVIHAAAAAEAGATRGFLIAGKSGSGKSTRLLRALDRGARVIADDSVRLRLLNGAVLASGLPGGIFIRHDSASDARAFLPVPEELQLREFPVASMLLLDPENEQTAPLRGPQALAALLRNRHRPRIAQLLRSEPDLLEPLAKISAALPVTPIRR